MSIFSSTLAYLTQLLSAAEAVRNSWWDDAGVLFVIIACENLARVYGALAHEHEQRAHKARISEKEKVREPELSNVESRYHSPACSVAHKE